MSWEDVTATTGIPGKPPTLKKSVGNYSALVTEIGRVVCWSVWGTRYQTAIATGETDSIESAKDAADSAITIAIDECG